MELKTELYTAAAARWPSTGQQILASCAGADIVVYQAYNHHIADYAVANQALGGPHYSYSRMSWIKPGFLWMMYRCGWASKPDQERVLAISLPAVAFDGILGQAALSSFRQQYYATEQLWKDDMAAKEVRLQWDPDHDPYGKKLTRRAIQLGLKGDVLEAFGKQQITRIEDITPFVKAQKAHLDNGRADLLLVPVAQVYTPADATACHRACL